MFFATSRLLIAILLLTAAAPIVRGAEVISNGPVSFLMGDDAINPQPGRQGGGDQFNSLFYVRPGEGEADDPNDPSKHQLPNQPFFIAYEATAGPVQSNDWWTGVGLQWYVDATNSGWAFSWNDGVIRSTGFISEPFYYQFVDFTGASGSRQPPLPPLHGLRLWNQNAIAVKTDGKKKSTDPFNPANNIVNRALLAPEVQAVVTVGLEGVHPLGTTKPTNSPWTNVRVRQHTDWGTVLAYKDGLDEMQITMANGSPFTWLERTRGQANFLVWAGGPTDQGGQPIEWQNQNGVLGLTINSSFNPDNNIPQMVSKAAYLVIANQGNWVRTNAESGKQAMFRNSTATRVVVLAMPHNVPLNDHNALRAAATALQPYACQKIVDTRIDYPPISGSHTSVNVGGQPVSLGYSPKNNLVSLQLRLETQPFLPGGCVVSGPIQLLFPHQFKTLHPGQRAQMDTRYTWNSIMGLLKLYNGSSFVQLIDTLGFLPFFPDQAVESDLNNPLQTSQLAVDDIYETMRNWFYLEELWPGQHLDSFVRNIGTYDSVQENTYEQKFSALIESLMIADQLAQSKLLTGDDTSTNKLHACLCKPKTQVAAEMRDYILQALKELVGQWADIYTAQFFQYNPAFKTTYGFPAGFGSVQNLNDHHFHYGYFLRAAAMIGRYDRAWLDRYLPLFDELRKDVANYDRANTNYPFLRNFSPFYGHQWANGTSGQNGADQESTSEAINFSAALIELGLLLGNTEWRDMGMYMYEQEIQASEQYWFNQDAQLTNLVPIPPQDPNDIRYNGNWPEQFVTFRGPDHGVWHSTVAGILVQRSVSRATFFADIAGTYFIHQIPMSANTLYFGRNQAWLQATWRQYLLDTGAQGNPNFESANETFMAAWQTRMPASGEGINGTGLKAALTRIARPHDFKAYGTNTMAKYWAYTNTVLGQVDTSIVADTPAHGVFRDAGGNRFVAYNPSNQPITANFRNRITGSVVATFSVPAQSIVSKSSDGPSVFTFKPTSQITPPPGRLYLGPTTMSTREGPLTGKLTSATGTWLPPDETYPFPNTGDISRITPSLSMVPVSTGKCSDLDPPGNPSGPNGGDQQCRQSNKAYAEWTGTFSGNLVGSKPFTQMTIYTDPALHPGWQRDPRIESSKTVRVEYYFDSTNDTPDRIEVYTRGFPNGNSFVMLENKFTPYYFGCYSDKTNFGRCNDQESGLYGLDTRGFEKIKLDDRFAPAAPFPAKIDKCGKIKVQVYGQAGDDQTKKVPVPVSVGTSPLLNRASWVQPPYDGGKCSALQKCSSFGDLMDAVGDTNLRPRAKKALRTKLRGAVIALAQGDEESADKKFDAFSEKLHALERRGQLDDATADGLEACAQKVEQSIADDF